MPGNAGDERGENQRRNDDFDQAQENVAEDAQVFGELRIVEPDFKAEQHGEEDPESERAPAEGGDGEEEECGVTEERRPEPIGK